MTALIALVRKDLLLYLNNRRALLLHLLMPVVLAAFFGSLFGGSGSDSADKGKIEIGLVLLDKSAISQRIGAGLKSNSVLNVHDLTQDEARSQVRKGKLAVALVLPQGFGDQAAGALFSGEDKPAIPLFYDPSQTTVLAMVKGLLTQQVMQEVSAAVMSPEGNPVTARQLAQVRAEAASDPALAPLAEFLDSFKKFQQQNARQREQEGSSAVTRGMSMPYHTADQALSSGPKYNGYAHSFAGMSVQFILFMGIDMGIGILLARRMGLWNRLQAAPVSLTTVLLGRVVSGALIAMGLMSAIFVCAVLIFKVQISNLPGFIGIAACFGLLTAGFGLLVAAFGKTPEAARGIASFATLILVMLGGAWVPSFLFPAWMQQLTLVVPTRWAVDGLDAVTWRGLDFAVAAQSMAVQLGFALLFGALAVWKFRRDQAA